MKIGDASIPDGVRVRPTLICSCGWEYVGEEFTAEEGLTWAWKVVHPFDSWSAAAHVMSVRLSYTLPVR